MEVKTYYTNFTFEEELKAAQKIQYQKKNQLFEFLFLWIEDESSSLWTSYFYSQLYLDKIKSYTESVPQLVNNAQDPILWWGNSRLLLEKDINDKLTSFRAREVLGYSLDNSYIIENENDLEQLFGDSSYLFKGTFGFSGRDQVRTKEEAKRLSYPFIAEPFLKRQQDLGLTFLNSDEYFCIENFNDEKGQFKGAYLLDRSEIPVHIVEAGKRIFDWYKNEFDVKSIQIDMFSYLSSESKQLEWNYLCEVNHRKTMGWVLWKLKSLFNTKYGALKIVNKNKKVQEQSGKLQVIELSPPGHGIKVLYIGSEREGEVLNYLQNLL